MTELVPQGPSATPSVKQWRRSYRLAIGSKLFESKSSSVALRIAFEVVRKTTPDPNRASIKIYNLSQDSRDALEALDAVSVRLEVGYQNFLQQIFFGTLTNIDSVKDGSDWITECSSGDSGDKLSSRKIYKSFAKGTPLSAVLSALVSALGVGTGNMASIAGILAGRSLASALTFSGPVSEEIVHFTRSNGLEWSIEDGNFQIVQIGKAIPGTEGPLISATTGLIGSPKVSKKGVVVGKALILPSLLPGIPFRVESSRVTADCVCQATRHYGDSASDDWFVEFKGVGIGKRKLKVGRER